MKLVKMKCENCGATLEVNKDLDKINCNFCGAEILIDDEASELRRVEGVKLQARKQNHEQTIKEKKDLEELNAVDNFKKGKFSKVLLIFAVICGIVTFSHGFSLSGAIAFLQTALFIGSWLLGMEIIKQPNKKLYIILALVGFALIIPFFSIDDTSESYEEKAEKIDISDVELVDHFPKPDKLYGRIDEDRKDLLMIDICDVSKKEYKNYINEKVIKSGYNLDLEYKNWDTVYGAFDKEGYSIRIIYDENDKEMDITLEAPEKMKEFEWPSNGLGSKVPKTKSNYGNISWDNEESFIVHVGNMSFDDYEEYVKKCENVGFTENRSKGEKSYEATNKNGLKIHLMYIGGNVVEISVEEETSQKEDNVENETTNSEGLSKNFKEYMDSYEKFINEYIKFMKKYNSNPTDTSLLKKYTDYMTKYADMLEKFEEWEDEDLNDEELEYYIKVQTRVNKKLADAALDN